MKKVIKALLIAVLIIIVLCFIGFMWLFGFVLRPAPGDFDFKSPDNSMTLSTRVKHNEIFINICI